MIMKYLYYLIYILTCLGYFVVIVERKFKQFTIKLL
jgi:hypothetical protein